MAPCGSVSARDSTGWIEQAQIRDLAKIYQQNAAVQESMKPEVQLEETEIDIQTSSDSSLNKGAISGYVYQADGTTPIQNAEVSADSIQWSNSETFYTAADGSYEISSLRSGIYEVTVSKEGYASASISRVFVGTPNTTADINFTLETGGSISGYIFETDGTTPIDDAYISASMTDQSYSTHEYSAENGSYTFNHLPSGTYQVRASKSGYQFAYYDGALTSESSTPIEVVSPNSTTGINFALESDGSISGYVFEGDGTQPIKHARVFAVSDTNSINKSSHSDSDGSFTISGLYTGEYLLYVEKDGYLTEYYDGVFSTDKAASVEVTAPDTTSGIIFTLETGGSISGHVYQADGTTPVSSVMVTAKSIDSDFSEHTYSATDGGYTLTTLISSDYLVYAAYGDYLTYYNSSTDSAAATAVTVVSPDTTSSIDFTLEIGGSISGYVFEEDGIQPINNARVCAVSDTYSIYKSSYSDSDGSFTISGLYTGDYLLYVEKDGYLTEYYDGITGTTKSDNATPIIIPTPDTTVNIDFTLDTGGSITGYVYAADGVTPLEEAEIYAYYGTSDDSAASVESNSDGSYTISVLPSGQYTLKASLEGYLTEYYNNAASSNEAVLIDVTSPEVAAGIDFTLDQGGTISGYVYESDEETPIKSAYVYAFLTGNSSATEHTLSEADGSYTITGLPSGDYILKATRNGFLSEYYNGVYDKASATIVSVAAPANTGGKIFTLDIGGYISGCVFQADGITPIEGAEVEAISTWTDNSESSDTGSDGSFLIQNLVPGNFMVSAKKSGFALQYYENALIPSEATPVPVAAPEITPNINFSLGLGGSISGAVYEADGETPIEEACVYAELTGADFDLSSSVDLEEEDGGSYTIIGLIAGNYIVHVVPTSTESDYLPEWYSESRTENQTTMVTVTDGNETENIDFTLPLYILTISITGQGSTSLPAGENEFMDESVSLTATAKSGWKFANWSGDLSGNTNPAVITMDANKSVTAVFTKTSSKGGGGGSSGGGSSNSSTATTPTAATKTVTTSGFISAPVLNVSPSGVVQSDTELQIEKDKAIFGIAKNTKLADANGKALETLTTQSLEEAPALPLQNMMIMGWVFGPEGATFDPPLTLNLHYDPATLPVAVNGNNVYLAYWKGSEWTAVSSTLDNETNTVTAQISHFSQYALLVKLLPPAEFTLSGLSITPVEAKTGDDISIQMKITNTGGIQDKYTGILKIDGMVEEQKEITLNTGASTTLTFIVNKYEPGQYKVEINGSTGQFTVNSIANALPAANTTPAQAPEETPPTSAAIKTEDVPKSHNFWFIIPILALVLLITGLILWRRKVARNRNWY